MMYPDWLRDQYENYRFLLKKYSGYSDERAAWPGCFSYENTESNHALQILKEKYRLDRLTRNRNDLDTCLRAMEWTFCQLASNKQQEFAGPLCAMEILNFSRAHHVTVNCLCHATVLTEVLLALGFKARTVLGLPADLVPTDNHVVTEVYVEPLSRWIMLDAALCCYVQDENGVILSLQEIRERLTADRPLDIRPYGRFQKIGAPNSSALFDPQEYRLYLTKNLFRFMSRYVQGTVPPAAGDIYYSLVPRGYLVPNTEQVHTEGGTKIIRFTDNADFFWRSEELLGEGHYGL
jgi:hypothetical protein